MGEIAEMMLDGMMCQWCGECIDDPMGFPTVCAGCQAGEGVDQHGNKPGEKPEFVGDLRDPRTIVCGYGQSDEFTGCQRKFRSEKDLRQHRQVKHERVQPELTPEEGK